MIVERVDPKTGKKKTHRNVLMTIKNNYVTLLGPGSGHIAEGHVISLVFLKHIHIPAGMVRINLEVLIRRGISQTFVEEYWYIEISEKE